MLKTIKGALVRHLPAFLPNSPSSSACVPVRGRSTISIVTTSDRASSLVHITRPGKQDSLLFCDHSFHVPHPVTVCSWSKTWNIFPSSCPWKGQHCVCNMKSEGMLLLNSGRMLAALMMIKRWNVPKCCHEAKHGSLWEKVLVLNGKHNDVRTLHMNQKIEDISLVCYKSCVIPYNAPPADTRLKITWPPFSCITLLHLIHFNIFLRAFQYILRHHGHFDF